MKICDSTLDSKQKKSKKKNMIFVINETVCVSDGLTNYNWMLHIDYYFFQCHRQYLKLI